MIPRLGLFNATGVELEYMLVRRDTLGVYPAADEILRAVAGAYTSDVERGPVTWSNELVLHVIEFKTSGPARDLAGLAGAFQDNVAFVNGLLDPLGGRLLPTAAHPTMAPEREARLWPHEYSPVYESFNRIFDCRGHGWSNLQSLHINLPFQGDEEFGRLHAAIRLILPILPALAASSPIVDGRATPFHDFRLEAYRTNAARVPSVSGAIIPEPVFTQAEYEERILGTMYRDIAPLDPDGILQCEWLNARGAIARFERDTIEIRLIDMQEYPGADVAIVALVVEVLRALVDEQWSTVDAQQEWRVEPLAEILLGCIRTSDETPIRDRAYLRVLGWEGDACSAGRLWRHLYETLAPRLTACRQDLMKPVAHILDHGTLARRILASVRSAGIPRTYAELADCLAEGRPFAGHA